MEIEAVADFKKCGAGKGADCCIFLVGGSGGAECARYTSLHNTLVIKSSTMNAKRAPTLPFPDCQTEGYIGDG